MKQDEDEDMELAKLAIAEADPAQVLEVMSHVAAQAREHGIGAAEVLGALYDEVVVAEAETLDELLGAWSNMLVQTSHQAFEGEADRAQVFGYVLEFAAGSAAGLGLPVEVAHKIVDNAYQQFQQVVRQAQEAAAAAQGGAPSPGAPKGYSLPGKG